MECILRDSDQNGVSLLYIMLEIHHCGWEPWICAQCGPGFILSSKRVVGSGVRTHDNPRENPLYQTVLRRMCLQPRCPWLAVSMVQLLQLLLILVSNIGIESCPGVNVCKVLA